MPGRKTDVNDARWRQQLHQHGLLRGSFRSRDGVVRLRAYLRHRERLLEYAATHIQHMQKALMQTNVQLHHVVADITGVTGMRILPAIAPGTHTPDTLAEFRDVPCAASPETIREALTGNYRPKHVFALRHALELYDFHHAKITERNSNPRFWARSDGVRGRWGLNDDVRSGWRPTVASARLGTGSSHRSPGDPRISRRPSSCSEGCQEKNR